MKVPILGEWITYLRDLIDDPTLPAVLRIEALNLIAKEVTRAKEKSSEDNQEDNRPDPSG